MTDIDGQVTDAFIYDPYGTLIEQTGETKSIFLYVGRYGVQTDDNGLYVVFLIRVYIAVIKFVQYTFHILTPLSARGDDIYDAARAVNRAKTGVNLVKTIDMASKASTAQNGLEVFQTVVKALETANSVKGTAEGLNSKSNNKDNEVRETRPNKDLKKIKNDAPGWAKQ